jgi:hypothetical protein
MTRRTVASASGLRGSVAANLSYVRSTLMGMAGEEIYEGIAVPDLRIDSVEWTRGQAEHIRTRSCRYARAFDIEPEWATEAALDPARRFGMDPGSKTGEGIRVVGRSAMAGRVLTVILVPEEHPPAGAWLGVTAWAARGRDLREYELRGTSGEAGDDTEVDVDDEKRGTGR